MTNTSSMVPTAQWGTPALRAFAEEVSGAPTRQALLCVECAAGGALEPPCAIVMVAGTSYCAEHAPPA